MIVEGHIISGNFDQPSNEFSIQRVKHLHTESTLTFDQVNHLYDYLLKHKDDRDGQVLTLYDQMPVRLSQQEIQQIIEDLQQIKSLYH